ncbi:predicted hydrolase [Pelotomaculum thermopropionicum SI]|uniref:Predicted hydrolase n=1 Tax=Pelotomaculum thermopropionicum (strain DSM 13744 / JCM 10971 / SI) TaxID=370438 RepID=A5D0V5_PELTS|nr:predicted hydrolase [Pelotomaculum thermopropionicum SI]
MNGTHLVTFHIGPVQDFIATARRSHDLWYGSWLLSELAKTAALEVVRYNGGDSSCLIFPASEGDSLEQLKSFDFSAPNKVVAVVSCNPVELGDAVKESINRRLDELSNDVFRGINGFEREVAVQQVKDFIEFFWASYPLNGNYKQARDFAEAVLSARKATRDFAQVSWGSSEPKCSLDGCRESVIAETIYKQMNDDKLYKSYRVQRGEYLCGVCLLKRHGKRGREEYFFSTSHVAALPLLERLTGQHRPLVEEYVGKLKELGIPPGDLETVRPPHPVFGPNDGHLLYEERFREFFFQEKEKIQIAQKALREFLKKAFGDKKPLPYYALLCADGDHMGKVIDAQKTPEKHRELSRSQSSFALEARRIVKENNGSLIYSGGDDVLALVPLHKVLDCACRLSKTFRERLAGFKGEDGGEEISPTLSVGIAVAHHLEPLSDVLELARSAEKAAKSVPGKNALAVTLSKRSGSERMVKGTWGDLDRQLKWLINLHRNEDVPDGAAYELYDLARRLETRNEELKGTLQEAACAEAKRILRRKKARRGTERMAEEVLAGLESLLESDKFSFEKLKQLADGLIIAREFAVAMELAGAPQFPVSTGEVVKK